MTARSSKWHKMLGFSLPIGIRLTDSFTIKQFPQTYFIYYPIQHFIYRMFTNNTLVRPNYGH
jgi:hypothetical protein